VGVVGGGQDLGTPGPDGCDPATADVGGGVQAELAVAVLVVVPGEEFLTVRPGGFDRGEPTGKADRYVSLLSYASKCELSLLMCGREWDWVTPMSASNSATGLQSSRNSGQHGCSADRG
jgi:hypothetical protein